jgi:hypothetical protein
MMATNEDTNLLEGRCTATAYVDPLGVPVPTRRRP